MTPLEINFEKSEDKIQRTIQQNNDNQEKEIPEEIVSKMKTLVLASLEDLDYY